MLKVGLIGLGVMGVTHLNAYKRLKSEGFPIQLTAICDARIEQLQGELEIADYQLYANLDEMLDHEVLDYVDITLPTFLHAASTVNALQRGLHVLCEKPMALNTKECKEMVAAAEQNRKQLMIGQCLRFWPEYEFLKDCVENQTYGKTLSAFFYRLCGIPLSNWFTQVEKSGGAILDLHIHDVDMLQWVFGEPNAVSAIAKNVIPGSGYDVVAANYVYEDGKVIHAQADWSLFGDYGFEMAYRVNFEHANLVFEKGILKVNPNEGDSFMPELSKDTGHFREIKYFAEQLMNQELMHTATPTSTMASVKIIEASVLSADRRGSWVQINPA